MSEELKPKWIEKLEKEIYELRSDFNSLADFVRKMNEYEKNVRDRLLDILKLLENHKDNEALLMAQIMKGTLNLDAEWEEVRKYAMSEKISSREAFEEMRQKNILPKGLRDFEKAIKMIREML